MARKQRIVHATDFSSTSRTAFATAVGLARAGGADLTTARRAPGEAAA